MKLPPLALVAPSLCPRCDAPAIMTDHCVQCALQIRQCAACLGIAGPFDRYCGFCGQELLFGSRRSVLRWLWLAVALVPLAAGIGIGSTQHLSAAASVESLVPGLPRPGQGSSVAAHTSRALGISYSLPAGWSAGDQAAVAPLALVWKSPADVAAASSAAGDLSGARPQRTLLAFTRPAVDASSTDATDPQSVLNLQITPLVSRPSPAGVSVEMVRPASRLRVNGHDAAKVVLKVTQDGRSYYLERVYVQLPQPGAPAVLRIDALVPAEDWNRGDADRVDSVVRSLRQA